MEENSRVVVHGYVYLYDREDDLRIVTLEPEEGSLLKMLRHFKLVLWSDVDPEKVFFGWNSKFEECYRNIINSNSNLCMVIDDSISRTLLNELISVEGDLIELFDGTYKIEI